MLDQLIEFRICQGEDPLACNVLFQQRSQSTKANPNAMSAEEMDKLALAIAKGIAVDQLPLSIGKSDLVKNLVHFFKPGCPIPSEKAIVEAVLRQYHSLAFDTKQVFRSDVAFGSFTSDTWSSKGNRKFIGLTYHYLQPDFTPRSVSIGFRPLEAPHTGEKLKDTI
ncbi:hypothetical protein BGZ79_006259, partial [Entomortierella chlamydospora]